MQQGANDATPPAKNAASELPPGQRTSAVSCCFIRRAMSLSDVSPGAAPRAAPSSNLQRLRGATFMAWSDGGNKTQFRPFEEVEDDGVDQPPECHRTGP
jgi:hypothetical protein